MIWTKRKYFVLIIGLIYSPRIQLGWLDSPYISLNLEDIAILIIVASFFLRRITVRGKRIRILLPSVSKFLIFFSIWITITVIVEIMRIGLNRFSLMSLLWLCKWFEYTILFYVMQQEFNSEISSFSIKVLLVLGFPFAFIPIHLFLSGNLIRRYSYLLNPNAAGVIFTVFALVYLATFIGDIREKKYPHSIIMLLGFLLIVVSTLLTLSRSGILLLSFSVFILIILIRNIGLFRKLIILAIVLSLTVVILIPIINRMNTYQIRRFTEIVEISSGKIKIKEGTASTPMLERIYHVKRNWEIFKENPLFLSLIGEGFYSTLLLYVTDNLYALLLIEVGAIGLVAAIGFYISILLYLRRRLKIRNDNPVILATFSFFLGVLFQSFTANTLLVPRILGILYLLIICCAFSESQVKIHEYRSTTKIGSPRLVYSPCISRNLFRTH